MAKKYEVQLYDKDGNELYPWASCDNAGNNIYSNYLRTGSSYLKDADVGTSGLTITKGDGTTVTYTATGSSAFSLILSDDYMSLPVAYNDTGADFPTDYSIDVEAYLGATSLPIVYLVANSSLVTHNEATLVYTLDHITVSQESSGPSIVSGKANIPMFNLSALEGKVKFELYKDKQLVARAFYTAVLNVKGEPGVFYRLKSDQQVITKSSTGAFDFSDFNIIIEKYEGASGTSVSFDGGYWSLQEYNGSTLTGTKYWSSSAWGSAIPIAGTDKVNTVTIKKTDLTSTTTKIIVGCYSFTGSSSLSELIDKETIDAIKGGADGDTAEANSIYAYMDTATITDASSNKVWNLPTVPTQPVTNTAIPSTTNTWTTTKITCNNDHKVIFSALQTYQQNSAGTYITGTYECTVPQLSEAYKAEVDPVEYATFVKLTKDGTQQGLYYGGTNNAQLYINANYIKTGILDANLITAGALTIQDASSNVLFKADATNKTVNIAGFSVDNNSIYNGTIGTASSVLMSTGKTSSTAIGGSSGEQTWAFTSGSNFGVTTAGTLYATSANITGAITATSGTIGGCTITDGKLVIDNANITELSASKLIVNGQSIGSSTTSLDSIYTSYLGFNNSLLSDSAQGLAFGSMSNNNCYRLNYNGVSLYTNTSGTGTPTSTRSWSAIMNGNAVFG